jgi:predicted nucleotidyltransferase
VPVVRFIPADFDPATVDAIDTRLSAVESDHGVRIPWAIESGSRAWGFASPDSDYDCRFFYVRSPKAYADLWPSREVIETPLDGLLDVNGWDLRKAVRLAVAGNATVGEWLRSPWVYSGDESFRDELLDLVAAVADPVRVRRHYLHVGRAQWARAGDEVGAVKLKRVFYAIRPAVTLHWLDSHDGVPPMNLDELLAETPVPDDVRVEVAELRELKARTRELGSAPAPLAIAKWAEATFTVQDDQYRAPGPELRELATSGFLAMLDRWAPGEA